MAGKPHDSETFAEDEGYAPSDYIRPIGRSEALASFARTQEIVRRALLSGGGTVVAPGEVEWDASKDCTSPHAFFQHEVAHDLWAEIKTAARHRRLCDELVTKMQACGVKVDASHLVIRRKPATSVALKVTVWVRCRKCEHCRKARSRMWAARAIAETEASVRTWFCTLTLSPAALQHHRMIARREAFSRSTDYDAFSESEKFKAEVSAIGPELQKWLKRVRKRTGKGMRFMLVAEQHQTGAPHFHALVHESSSAAIKYRDLDHWPLGVVRQFKLITDKRAVFYVCKYVAKEVSARVRASTGYGSKEPSCVSVTMPPPTHGHPSPLFTEVQHETTLAALGERGVNAELGGSVGLRIPE